MDDYLVFQLYAPLASWGGQAVGQERPSDDHPSRSALLGMLAAALGIRRNEETKHRALSDTCRFGIKLLAPGLALRDFHTISIPKGTNLNLHTRREEVLCFEKQSKSEVKNQRPNPIVSSRTYRQDTLNIVTVTSDSPHYGINNLTNALLKPIFPLYLGRKSCPPALPLNPKIISADNMKSALDSYKPYDISSCPGMEKPRYFWEAGMNAGITHDYSVPRYDQPVSRRRWQFEPRDEFVWLGGE